jgi:hypothetical protein
MNGQYYLEPIGPLANERIFELLAELAVECEAGKTKCGDGQKPYLIAVPPEALAICLANRLRKKRGLTFNVFQDIDGKIMPVDVVMENPIREKEGLAAILSGLNKEEVCQALRLVMAGKIEGCQRKGRTLPVGVTPHNARRRPGPKPKKGTIHVKASFSIRT